MAFSPAKYKKLHLLKKNFSDLLKSQILSLQMFMIKDENFKAREMNIAAKTMK